MKNSLKWAAVMAVVVCAAVSSCMNKSAQYVSPEECYQMVELQKNTAVVKWNPEDYDFEEGNVYCAERFQELVKVKSNENEDENENSVVAAGGCSSWRNGRFHGRNLDWNQMDFACLVVQMPKGDNVKHASVALLNGNTLTTQEFLKKGVIEDKYKKVLPCLVVDGINDAGVAANVNIVTHTPGDKYVYKEGDLSCLCVVRYVLDNAGSVKEAIQLLKGRKVRQDLVELVGDETHYMISDKDMTAVVEFDNGEMVVTEFNKGENGFYSENNTPAIMTNLYDFAIERYGIDTDEFYEHHPLSMGVERWKTIEEQYAKAANSVMDNGVIAQSVWYFKNFMAEKKPWLSENAVPTAYGKDAEGWYFMKDGVREARESFKAAETGFWNGYMSGYWTKYAETYGKMKDPHVKGNTYWETSHSVVYDLDEKVGYLWPFENFYSEDQEPIVIGIAEGI